MKRKKIILLVISIILFSLFVIRSTHSRLNLTFTEAFSFISPSYEAMTITDTVNVDVNSYKITLVNNNDYSVGFDCEVMGSNFAATCNKSIIAAKTTEIINVNLEILPTADLSTATPNPIGDGYIVRVGIKATSPYLTLAGTPQYTESENMVVVQLVGTNLAQYLKSSADSSMAVDHLVNKRYIGLTPNNYVRFNNEIWRIIGVFDNSVKIIRTTAFNDTPYMYYDGDDTGSITKFATAKISTQLNTAFYNSLSSKYRGMVVKGNWYVGGINTWDLNYAKDVYNKERLTTYQAHIGLISPSEYAYAMGGGNRATCIDSTHIGNLSSCSTTNWLFPYATKAGMWTVNEFTGTSGYALMVNTTGDIAPNGIHYTSTVYPVVYLDPNTEFTSGLGTVDSPFNLKLGDGPIQTFYNDSITNVYFNSWGNAVAGFAEKTINSFDSVDGAKLFDNATWGIPSTYTIDQVTIYGYDWSERTTYYNRTWEEDYADGKHARTSNYIFKRQVDPDLGYIGGSAILNQNSGSLRFVIIVK